MITLQDYGLSVDLLRPTFAYAWSLLLYEDYLQQVLYANYPQLTPPKYLQDDDNASMKCWKSIVEIPTPHCEYFGCIAVHNNKCNPSNL